MKLRDGLERRAKNAVKMFIVGTASLFYAGCTSGPDTDSRILENVFRYQGGIVGSLLSENMREERLQNSSGNVPAKPAGIVRTSRDSPTHRIIVNPENWHMQGPHSKTHRSIEYGQHWTNNGGPIYPGTGPYNPKRTHKKLNN